MEGSPLGIIDGSNEGNWLSEGTILGSMLGPLDAEGITDGSTDGIIEG